MPAYVAKCRQTEQCIGLLLLTGPESHCHFLGHDPKSRLHQRGAADTALVLECWNVTPRGPEDSFGREDRLGLTERGCQISSLFGTVCKRGCWSISELLCKQCGAEENFARPAGCFCFFRLNMPIEAGCEIPIIQQMATRNWYKNDPYLDLGSVTVRLAASSF